MARKKKSRSRKGFDWTEFDEAVGYFVRRFAGEDVTISSAGVLIRVMPGHRGQTPEYSVLRDEKGWNVWELTPKGDTLLRTCRSYEQSAVFLEKRILGNPAPVTDDIPF